MNAIIGNKTKRKRAIVFESGVTVVKYRGSFINKVYHAQKTPAKDGSRRRKLF